MSWVPGTLFVAVLLLGPARIVAGAPTRELVIASEDLTSDDNLRETNLAAFLRRIEQVTGWPAGSLRGKAFPSPADALAYMRSAKPAFAILPVHQFVEARRARKLDVLGKATWLDGDRPAYWGVARKEKRTWKRPMEQSGLRLAMTEIHDLQWIRVLFEGEIKRDHFNLIKVKNDADAVAAVIANRADVAMIREYEFETNIRKRVEGGAADLTWVYTSGGMPAHPIVALGPWAKAADKKKLAAALPNICRADGAQACARMTILHISPADLHVFRHIITKYETY